MKLIETIENPLIEGLFFELEPYLNWLTEEEVPSINSEYYFNRSGDKEISSYYQRIIDNTEDTLYIVANTLYLKYGVKWRKLYDAIVAEYNPIHNYNMTSEEKTDTKLKTTGENYNSYYGFNSTSALPTDNTDGINIVEGSGDENKVTTTRSGNIGVTTTQKMLMEEFEVRKTNFYEIVFSDIDKLLCLRVWKR